MKQGMKQEKGRGGRVLVILACIVALNLMTAVNAAADSYTTEGYDVDVVVSEDNILSVTETMNVDFYEASHGIYRYIPYKGDITYQYDGQVYTKPYASRIKDVEVPGFEKDVSHENGMVVVRIGSEDELVEGPVSYKMSYNVEIYDDRTPELDQVYWGLIPTDTPTATEKATFRIQMPKAFDVDKVAFIAGQYGQADGDAVDFRVEGNTIYGATNRRLYPLEGVTLRIELPEGYFAGEASKDWMMTAMWILIGLAPVAAFILWLIFGRDKKIVPTVEFYPPEGVSPAEIGYILDGASDDADVISIILYFADKGYLEIHEEGKNSFRLVKKKAPPQNAKSYEWVMFSGLFRKGDSVRLSDLKGDFFDTFVSVKELLAGEFTGDKGRQVYTKGSKIARLFSLFLMINPLLALVILGTSYQYRDMILCLISLPLTLLVFGGLFWMIYIYDKKDNMKSGLKAGGRIGAAATILLGMAGFLIFGSVLDLLAPACGAVAASLICGFFAMLMKQRTPFSLDRMGKILGFKEFIRTAELPRLQKLVEESPQYFYHILPYAYVFGLTDKWAKHFEGIAVAPPDWYHSPYGGSAFTTFYFLNSINNCTRAMQSNIAAPPVSEDSGIGGGGGGGFSGGGFSGGGMGGGGMGSW